MLEELVGRTLTIEVEGGNPPFKEEHTLVGRIFDIRPTAGPYWALLLRLDPPVPEGYGHTYLAVTQRAKQQPLELLTQGKKVFVHLVLHESDDRRPLAHGDGESFLS